MKKSKLMIVAVSLVVVGLMIAAVGLWAVDFDFTKLSLGRLTANTYTIEEDFTKISVTTDISDVTVVPTDDGSCRVVCLEEVSYYHKVSVEGSTLTVTLQDERMWYEHVGIHIGEFQSVTVYVPKEAYEDLTVTCSTADVDVQAGFSFGMADIQTSTGDIKWKGSAVNDLFLSVSTGDIRVDNTGCQNLTAKTSTGDIRLTSTVITQKLFAKTSTGDIQFDGLDAKTMDIHTDTGDVGGTLLSNKFIITDSNGRVLLPTASDGPMGDDICTITTDTGDIRIDLAD